MPHSPGQQPDVGLQRFRPGSVASALAITVSGALPAFLAGALSVQMRTDLGFSARQLGLAIGAFFVVAAISAGLLGRVVQRSGVQAGIRFTAIVSLLSLLGIAVLAHNWPVLLLLLVIGGVANGAAHPAANMALVAFVPRHRQGLAFGIKQAAIPVATLSAGAAVPLLALTVGWRWAFVAAAMFPAATLVSTPRAARSGGPKQVDTSRPLVWREIGAPLALITLGAGLSAMAGNAAAVFTVPSAFASGLSEAAAGTLLAVGSALTIVMRVGVGWWADRGTHGPVLLAAVMLAGGSVGFWLLASSTPWVIAVAACLALALGWGWPGLIQLAVATARPGTAASATGILQPSVFVGAAAGPVLFGIVATAWTFAAAWTLTGFGTITGAALLWLAHRRLPQNPSG